MTELERKLLAQNEQLKRELAELKNFSSAEIEILDETHAKFNGQIFAKTKKVISTAPFHCTRLFGIFTSATFPKVT